jgi:murein DD-endopeptidase MepM/ murein hydrolase activator NlpD
VWNNLRARHYSVLILLAIVALETSAIAIDKFINRESETAFTIESPFQNNPFIQSFKMADASCAVIPVKFNRTRLSTPAAPVQTKTAPAMMNSVLDVPRTVSAEFVAAASRTEDNGNYIEYSVQPGDSLSNIAQLFGSATDAIKKANQLDDRHSIKAGQTIKVPMPGSEMFYTVKKGDSLSKIASRFRVPLKTLVEENNLKSHMLMAEQRIRIPLNDNKPEIQIIKSADAIENTSKKLELVKEEKQTIVAEQKLQLVKTDKVQMVQAQAPASKPDLDLLNRNLLKNPPAVSNTMSASENGAAANQTKEVTYTVAKGDSLLKIAQKFNTTVAQLQEVNGISGTMLKVGQEIKVNPDMKLYRVVKAEDTTGTLQKQDKAKSEIHAANTVNNDKTQEKTANAADGIKMVEHKVQAGESLSMIARRYRTSISAIVEENNLTSTVVKAEQTIKVPASASAARDFKVVQGASQITRASMRMPVRGRLSDKYGWRKHTVYRKRLFHAGIDIAAPKGAPIAASMNGKVIYAGRRAGYGNLVILSHAGGYSSRYAHCSSILVKKGQIVKAGQLIARVGATGVATGNHLHFEVRKNGKPQNPLTYLK